MTTQINVIVDNGGLSAKAKQQTQVNRWSKLESDNRQKVEATGTQQRDANRAQQGIGPDGRPLYGTPPAQPLRRDEPAAFRSATQGLNLGHLWIAYPNDTITTSTGIAGISNNLSDLTTRNITGNSHIYFGVGTGREWLTLDYGYFSHPGLPSESWSVYGSQELSPNSFSYKATRDIRWSMSQSSRMSWFLLPVGKGAFILVFMDKYIYFGVNATVKHEAQGPAGYTPAGNPSNPYLAAFSYPLGGDVGYTAASSYQYSERRNRVYICTNSTARQITSFSSALQQILDLLNPAPTVSTATTTINGQSFSYAAPSLGSMPAGLNSVLEGGQGYRNTISDQNGGQSIIYTPYAFELLDSIVPFAGSTIKQYSSELRWGLPDQSQGGYSRFVPNSGLASTYQAAYGEGLPLYHALWKNKNEIPSLQVYDPAYSGLGLPMPTRINKATLALEQNRVAQSDIYDLVTVWDWDDPAYCRQMCLALGFTEADLTP